MSHPCLNIFLILFFLYGFVVKPIQKEFKSIENLSKVYRNEIKGFLAQFPGGISRE